MIVPTAIREKGVTGTPGHPLAHPGAPRQAD